MLGKTLGRFTVVAAALAPVAAWAQPAPPVPAEGAPPPPPSPAPTPSSSETAPSTPAAPPVSTIMPALPAAASPEPAPPSPAHPLAGWYNGVFYLRDETDDFRLYVQGRAQVDMYNFFGPGVADSTLKSTVLLRRIRPEITGEIMKNWQFSLAGDFGQTGNTSATAVPTEQVVIRAAPTDVFIIYKADPLLNFQFGQYDAPFTMENRTSDKYFPFMERSLAVRAFGIPTNKEIGLMAWGETPGNYFFYSAGVFNGDGQNRVSPDNRADLMGRVFAHPLADQKGEIKDLQIGASVRYGVRDNNYVTYDYPTMSTQSGYTFWKSTYTGNGKVPLHVIPSGGQMAFAGELRIPVSDFDLTGEFVYLDNKTREASENYGLLGQNSLRFGELKGSSYYVELGYWPIGNRDVNGLPGYENPPSVNFKKPPKPHVQALQLLVKWEQLSATYDSASRGGTADTSNIDGDIKVNALSFGANYWATKHLRLSFNYVMDMFPDSAPSSATKSTGGAAWTSSQRAQAPGNGLSDGVNDSARDSAHVLHEVAFRAAIAL